MTALAACGGMSWPVALMLTSWFLLVAVLVFVARRP